MEVKTTFTTIQKDQPIRLKARKVVFFHYSPGPVYIDDVAFPGAYDAGAGDTLPFVFEIPEVAGCVNTSVLRIRFSETAKVAPRLEVMITA